MSHTSPDTLPLADHLVTDPTMYRQVVGCEPVVCIDPRRMQEQPGLLPAEAAAVQTGGGEAGVAQDQAWVETALSGSPVTLEDVLGRAPSPAERVGLGHGDFCKFLGGRALVMYNAGQPDLNPEAQARTARWVNRYAQELQIPASDLSKAVNILAATAALHGKAMARNADDQAAQDKILDFMRRRAHHGRPAVAGMVGNVTADVYVTNHTATALDRERMQDSGDAAQFFHDNVGVLAQDGWEQAGKANYTGVDRALFAAAPLLRASATITTLDQLRAGHGQAPLRHYEVTNHASGLRVALAAS